MGNNCKKVYIDKVLACKRIESEFDGKKISYLSACGESKYGFIAFKVYDSCFEPFLKSGQPLVCILSEKGSAIAIYENNYGKE